MPDLEFASDTLSNRLTQGRDYVSVSRRAIAEMHRQIGDLVFHIDSFDEGGIR